MPKKNKFIFVSAIFLLAIMPAFSQGKLISKLRKINFNVSYYISLDLLKKRVDTTKVNENKVIYSKTGNVVYGLIYLKEDSSIGYFHENISKKKYIIIF